MLYFYIGCLAFGFIYSIVSLFIGHDGSVDHVGHSGFDHSSTQGHEQGDSPSILNPVVIASALTAFGACGTASTAGFGFSFFPALFTSIGFAGIIGTVIFYGVVRMMYRAQSDSTFSMEDLPGCEVEIITPVPEKGVGEVVFYMSGERHNLPAKSLFGESFVRGEKAIVHKIEGGIMQLVKLKSNKKAEHEQREIEQNEDIKQKIRG